MSPPSRSNRSRRALTAEQEQFYRASQWRIMWWKFRRHKIALISAWVLMFFYASILVSEVLSPYNLHSRDTRHIYAPPQELHLFHDGKFVGPFVYGYTMELNMQTMRREFIPTQDKLQPLRFFCRGEEYEFWNLFEAMFTSSAPLKAARSSCSAPTASARCPFPHDPWHAHIADRWIARHRRQFPDRHHAGRHFRLLRRLDRQRHPALHRNGAFIPGAAALDGALGGAAVNWSPVLVYFGITIILGLLDWPASRARCDPNCWHCGRRNSPPRRCSWARRRAA